MKSQLSFERGQTAGSNIKAYLIGVLAAMIISIIILAVFAALLVYTDIPDSSQTLMTYICMCIGALTGGIISAGMIGRNGLVCGLICGLLYMFLVLCAGFFMTGHFLPESNILIKIGLCALCGCLGGVIGVNIKRK